MFKKLLLIFVLTMTFIVIDKVSAECVIGNGMSHYDIKFETNGGNELQNMQICSTCNDFMNAELPIPTRDGYVFLRWYADQNLTIPIYSVTDDWDQTNQEIEKDSENCPTGKINVTLYAKWQSTNCIITDGGTGTIFNFDTNGGEEVENISICHTCGDALDAWENTTLPIPTKANDTFLGWYADENLTIKVESIKDENIKFKEVVDSNDCETGSIYTILYAKWKSMECPIKIGGTGTIFSFETNDGDKVDNISICDTCSDALTAWETTSLPETKKDGYKFLGWYADKDLSTKVESIKDNSIKFENKYDENGCSDGNSYATLYAKWEKIENVSADNVDVDNTLKNTEIFGIVFALVLIISGVVIYKYSLKSVKQNKN